MAHQDILALVTRGFRVIVVSLDPAAIPVLGSVAPPGIQVLASVASPGIVELENQAHRAILGLLVKPLPLDFRVTVVPRVNPVRLAIPERARAELRVIRVLASQAHPGTLVTKGHPELPVSQARVATVGNRAHPVIPVWAFLGRAATLVLVNQARRDTPERLVPRATAVFLE